jgi:hypothetical protein
MKKTAAVLMIAAMYLLSSCAGQSAGKKGDKAQSPQQTEDFDLIIQKTGKAVQSPIPSDFTAYQGNQSASVQTYIGGENTVKLQPVPAKIGYSLPLSGWTKYKILWIQIGKPGGKPHDIKFMPGWDGNFSVYYILKDGAGDYKVTLFAADDVNSQTFQALLAFNIKSQADAPKDIQKLSLNPYIIDFVNAHMGQTVGRGECWDLAQAALDLLSADWTRTTGFGIPLDPEKDDVIPGDIIQFKTVKVTYSVPNGTVWETYGNPDHTAIVYKVLGKLHYQLAHQNVKNTKVVMITELDLNNKTSGQVWFYRPVMGLVQD